MRKNATDFHSEPTAPKSYDERWHRQRVPCLAQHDAAVLDVARDQLGLAEAREVAVKL
jgi:hypothetical protein